MTTRRERRLAALERLHPPPPPPRPEIAWLSAMTVPELCVLERLAYDGATAADHPLFAALVAAGQARLAGHAVEPLATEPPLGQFPANVGAITGETVWISPPEPEAYRR